MTVGGRQVYLQIKCINYVYTHGVYYGIKDIIPKGIDIYV